MSSPNNMIMPSNNISYGNIDIVPEHMSRWIIIVGSLRFIDFLSNYAGVLIGHLRRLVEAVPSDREAPRAEEVEQAVEFQRTLEVEGQDPPRAEGVEHQPNRTEVVEPLEAIIFFIKIFLFVSTLLTSAASSGIFAFLQINKGKAKPTLKHIYIACSVCLAISIVVVVAGVALILIPWQSGLKSLILKLAIGSSLVLFMSDSFLAIITFNIGN